jgi:hypothetical protein
MSIIKYHISWLLLIIFGYVITPVALIHELNGHEDNHCIARAKASVDAMHVHCKSLQIEAQVFTAPEPLLHTYIPEIYQQLFSPRAEQSSLAIVNFANLRAPPLI